MGEFVGYSADSLPVHVGDLVYGWCKEICGGQCRISRMGMYGLLRLDTDAIPCEGCLVDTEQVFKRPSDVSTVTR